MKAGLLSVLGAFILSCTILPYSFIVEARLMGLSPHIIHPPQKPALHYNNEVGNFFQDAHMRRSATMKKEQISIVPAKNKFAATEPKLSVQVNDVHNLAERIEEAETPASNNGGTVIFSKRRNESKNDQTAPATKKSIEVMAFRPSSSGHSPGIGHGNTAGPRL